MFLEATENAPARCTCWLRAWSGLSDIKLRGSIAFLNFFGVMDNFRGFRDFSLNTWLTFRFHLV